MTHHTVVDSFPVRPRPGAAHLAGVNADQNPADPRRWDVLAGLREGPDGPEFCDFYTSEWLVREHGHDEVHEVTLVEDPDGDLRGWVDADQTRDPGVVMVHHHKVFEVQFPYGSASSVARGKGEVVSLRAEPSDFEEDAAPIGDDRTPMMWLEDALGLGAEGPEPYRDNLDPHPVILTVHPREEGLDRNGKPVTYEAEYEISHECPSTCSGAVEECPLADIVETQGTVWDELRPGFGVPEPDFLTDAVLAAMNGTVRFVVTTRRYSSWSNADGTEWDVEYTHAWTDNPPTEKNGRLL